MVLQAFTDDSSSDIGEKKTFFSGYLNRADKWERFSDAWAEELRYNKPIEYLKMSEAKAMQGQFRGWSKADRDAKIKGLRRVINHFEPLSFHFSISRSAIDSSLKPVAPRGLCSPHFALTFFVVSSITQHMHKSGVKMPIDFVFDDQVGVSSDIDVFFESMIRNIPKAARQLINNKPIFRNEKLFLPLQAADMLAWHIRRGEEKNSDPFSMCYNLISKHHLYSNIPNSYIDEWAEKIAQLPNIRTMQSKSDWRNLRKTISTIKKDGYLMPYGTRFNNFRYSLIERLARLIRR